MLVSVSTVLSCSVSSLRGFLRLLRRRFLGLSSSSGLFNELSSSEFFTTSIFAAVSISNAVGMSKTSAIIRDDVLRFSNSYSVPIMVEDASIIIEIPYCDSIKAIFSLL